MDRGLSLLGVDDVQANAARMYDYLLGGGHNFAVDRDCVRRAIAANPDLPAAARANRSFLFRVVCWCLHHGVDQFLDLGSGIPTIGSVHQIAGPRRPGTRVAYVDVEPVAVAHARALLVDQPRATITHADLSDVAGVLGAPGVAGLLDFTRPVAVLATAVLHFVPGDLAPIMHAYRRALVAGSVLAFSHGSDDHDGVEGHALDQRLRTAALAYRDSATPVTYRARRSLMHLCAGLDPVPPGLVDVTDWPTPTPHRPPSGFYGSVWVVP